MNSLTAAPSKPEFRHTRSNKIFLAFNGSPSDASQPAISKFGDIEIWSLKGVDLDTLIGRVQLAIPPVNSNAEKNYIKSQDSGTYGTSSDWIKHAAWGLLLSTDEDPPTSSFSVMQRLNLYSKEFLKPLFHATDLGIHEVRSIFRPPESRFYFHDNASHFASEKFRLFYEMIQASLPTTDIFSPENKLTKEEWRREVAVMLFNRLHDYDLGRDFIGWEREAADICVIIEMLLTAKDASNAEIQYRLRTRAGALLEWKFPSIQDDIKALYKLRSGFVHGNFFAEMSKKMTSLSAGTGGFLVDIESLWKFREMARFILVSYLWLSYKSKETKYAEIPIISLIDKSFIDTALREWMVSVVKEIADVPPCI